MVSVTAIYPFSCTLTTIGKSILPNYLLCYHKLLLKVMKSNPLSLSFSDHYNTSTYSRACSPIRPTKVLLLDSSFQNVIEKACARTTKLDGPHSEHTS